MSGDDGRSQFAAFQSHQHAAAGKRIDEGRRMADGNQATSRSHRVPAKSFQRDGEPRRVDPRTTQRLRRAPVLTDDFPHHSIRVGVARAHIARRGDEAEIAEPAFDAAQSAVTTAIEIDLAGAGLDARVEQVSLESYQRRALWPRTISGAFQTARQRASPARRINRDGRAKT